ncbi:MAG: ABC transporter permease, partial [Deinococcus-Thermus bacterium]|nr:ABC transporter permease [Deinococcota bacterium]
GNMLADARSVTVLRSQPWLWLPPGAAIFVTVLAINFLGDGLRDAVNPRAGRR